MVGRVSQWLRRLWRWDVEAGQGMVEYGLIIALVAVGLIVIISSMSGSLGGIFKKIGDTLSSQ